MHSTRFNQIDGDDSSEDGSNAAALVLDEKLLAYPISLAIRIGVICREFVAHSGDMTTSTAIEEYQLRPVLFYPLHQLRLVDSNMIHTGHK